MLQKVPVLYPLTPHGLIFTVLRFKDSKPDREINYLEALVTLSGDNLDETLLFTDVTSICDINLSHLGGKTHLLWLLRRDDQEEGSGSTHFRMSLTKHLLSTHSISNNKDSYKD